MRLIVLAALIGQGGEEGVWKGRPSTLHEGEVAPGKNDPSLSRLGMVTEVSSSARLEQSALLLLAGG